MPSPSSSPPALDPAAGEMAHAAFLPEPDPSSTLAPTWKTEVAIETPLPPLFSMPPLR